MADASIQFDVRENQQLAARQVQSRRGAVALGFGLLLIGAVFLMCSAFMATGIIDANYWYPGQGWQGPALTFFCLGFVTFCPGTWAVRIVYHVWRGTPGYSLTQLPAVAYGCACSRPESEEREARPESEEREAKPA